MNRDGRIRLTLFGQGEGLGVDNNLVRLDPEHKAPLAYTDRCGFGYVVFRQGVSAVGYAKDACFTGIDDQAHPFMFSLGRVGGGKGIEVRKLAGNCHRTTFLRDGDRVLVGLACFRIPVTLVYGSQLAHGHVEFF